MLTAAIILIITYIGVIFTRLPHMNIDRPAAAITGGLLMVLCGVLTFDQAVRTISYDTIVLLLGMMLLVAALQQTDFFTMIATKTIALAKHPRQLLILVVVITAVGSAFLVNDIVVLIFTPVVISACRIVKSNPVPYLIAEAMASNIGSVATIVGNPQNMLIGVASGISFTRFMVYLLPVAIVSTIILLAVVFLVYRREMAAAPAFEQLRSETLTIMAGHSTPAARARLMKWILPVLVLTIICLFFSSFLGMSVFLVAMAGGVAAMLFSGIKPSRLIQTVDWPLLLFFAGLFVVIGGAEHAGVLDIFVNNLKIGTDAAGIWSIHIFSTVVSQLVSNVPLTMLVMPMIQQVPGDVLWISLASGSTLGGNATIIGAVANIIVVEQAFRQDVKVGWWEFTKTGLIVTALTIAASSLILSLEQAIGLLH